MKHRILVWNNWISHLVRREGVIWHNLFQCIKLALLLSTNIHLSVLMSSQNWKTPLSHTSVLSSVVWHGPFVFSREWDNNVHFLVPSTQTLCTTITSKETYFYIQYRRQLLALLRSVQCCGGRWGDVMKCQIASFLGVVQLGSTASRVSQ